MFSGDDLFILACGWFILQAIQTKRIKRRKPRYWVRPFLSRCTNDSKRMLNVLQKDDFGFHGELRSSFQNFVRMSSAEFENLINLVGNKICKQNSNYRDAVSVKDRLAITLRFIATGDSYQSLMYLFRVSVSSKSRIVPQVCSALCESLMDYIKVPGSSEEWRRIAHRYNAVWNFPMCIGSMDGKNIVLQSPKYSGSEFYNYKGIFSIVLFAVVDANYYFIYVSIGSQGHISDRGVFKSTGKALDRQRLNLPPMLPFPGRDKPAPYVLLADDAFPLSKKIMKRYPGHQEIGSRQSIFNYRISRARRVVENVFGILASVFRILRKPILLEPQEAEKIVETCVLLHNHLRRNSEGKLNYTPPGSFDMDDLHSGTVIAGSWTNDTQPCESLQPLRRMPRKLSEEAKAIRDEFSEYVMSVVGQVHWQLQYA